MRSGSAPDAGPWIALVGLGLAAAVLALIGLGDLPLRDFDEATVARVALELRHGLGEAPFLPTLWDKPYLNKAPGLHSLIALVIRATTQPDQLPSEWTIRLAPAVLSCLVVPLGGWLQWLLRPGDRSSALATSVILLTLLPVARRPRAAGATSSCWKSFIEFLTQEIGATTPFPDFEGCSLAHQHRLCRSLHRHVSENTVLSLRSFPE